MAKKNNDDFIIDFDDSISEYTDDLLAQKNKEVLSSFGKSIDGEKKAEPGKVNTVGKKISPLDALRKKMSMAGETKEEKPADDVAAQVQTDEPLAAAETVAAPEKEEAEQPQEMSLLEKLKRYTIDESGHDVSQDESPLYTLESVAEIIKSDSNKLIDKLSEKYDVTIDTLGKPGPDDFLLKGIDEEPEKEAETEEPAKEEKPDSESPSPTPAFEQMANESKQRFEKSLFDELFPAEIKPTETKPESTPDISDIDSVSVSDGAKSPVIDAPTVRFTPIMDKTGNTGRINISSTTKPIDIRQELTNTKEIEPESVDSPLEMSAFDVFVPETEVTDTASAKALLKKLLYKKRRNFVSLVLCSLCIFVLLLFFLPPLADATISSPKATMVVCSIFLFIPILANIDMFKDIMNLFKGRAGHDCVISICAALSVLMCISAISAGRSIYHLILTSALIVFTRCIVEFMQTNTLILNLKKISAAGKKHAVTFIKDDSTALAMAKDAIDGDVLIAVPREADFLSDFMKYSLFKKKFSGKMPIIFSATGILCILSAIIGALYTKNAFSAIGAAAVSSMIAAMPLICFVDALPLFFAAKRLSKKGAMISGIFGADALETANAAVVKTSDIFPSGSIVLKSFKVLSNNNVDKTIVNAAALTEEIGSPLAPIFNKIAGTNASYEKPDSDTIKYEEKLGISGWVDDELLFIGNRTLMEAHGIEVPSIEVDKKILRNGYFPVYVATGGNACALVVVEYTVRRDVQRVLRKISRLGITMLLDNCDPNVTEEMVCDYFGIYDDSVKVMTNVGTYMYNNATAKTDVLPAPAAIRSNKFSLLNIMCCASNIKVSNLILSVFYVLAAVFGIWYFVFTSFTQSGEIIPGSGILLFEVLATVFSFVSFLFKKP